MTQESASDLFLRSQVDDATFAFLHALLADPELSVSNAARAVGLEPAAGARLMRKANVRAVLGQLLAERKARHEDVRSSVVLMLWKMACADPRRAWDEQGQQLAPHELPDELAAVLESVKPIVHEGVTVAWSYTFAKRTAVLDMLLKHFDAPKAEASRSASGPQARVVFRGVVNAPTEEDTDV